ncbi:MAG: carbamoyl-phosphate synthase large subunit [Anaerolineae bacterium]
MPKRTDIRSILIIGSGPIVIGQACEFDYSGVQACKALRAEGYRIVLANSNPATIMTDPEFADATYVEPLTPEIVEKIIARERPDALLPTVGGQTGLNLAVQLARAGILDRYGVELIGANLRAIETAEDRRLFDTAMRSAGLPTPPNQLVSSVEEALQFAKEIGYPLLIRPSFTLGGSGAGVAHNDAELRRVVDHGLRESPVHQVLVEMSLLGWKEYELEAMRDRADNFVVVCSIENIDPMGIHTGDSITVAPAMTLTDRELQRLRDMARMVMSAVGVETGGSNVQFAVNPQDGRVMVIEMNPRVSRSSALASKATGFPIAKIAALIAVGYTLDEIRNDITRETPASFEPSLDYVVVKMPRWAFEKFPGVDPTLGPQMKSVGEVMAIGRTFKEALHKAIRSLELDIFGLEPAHPLYRADNPLEAARNPTAQRLFHVAQALRQGASVQEVSQASGYDPWFVTQIAELLALYDRIAAHTVEGLPAELWLEAKRAGLPDREIARLCRAGPQGELLARQRRQSLGIIPAYYRVDTCAAEFEAYTPYLYSTYEPHDEANPSRRHKVMILGAGPNRIGQGIEFDYCCVNACFAFKELGYETIMVNCNPETVSTDYDTADRLYFEPLTLEDVLNIVEEEKPDGVVLQFGGQTPLKLARALEAAGVPIWGTPPDSIDLAEDRGRMSALLQELEIPQPESGVTRTPAEARAVAQRIGFPLLLRPSYVLGGRGMVIVYNMDELNAFLDEAMRASEGNVLLLDRFLEDAFEIDVDAVADGEHVVIGGIMQHIEEAGVHSGDSACILPPYKVSLYHLNIIREYTHQLGLALGVRGLMNIQFAIKDEIVYVLEVNPRASRTVPFVSKATGVSLAKIAAKVIAGQSLAEIGFTEEPEVKKFFVKESVLPFHKFAGVDARLGPEMRSTGEVMGIGSSFGEAFAKAEMAANMPLPTAGTALISVNDFDKGAILKIARDLARLGFRLMATPGTAEWLRRGGLEVEAVNKVSQGSPHVVDAIAAGKVDLIINTPLGHHAFSDGMRIRAAATQYQVPLLTTLSAAMSAVGAIRALQQGSLSVHSLQELYGRRP